MSITKETIAIIGLRRIEKPSFQDKLDLASEIHCHIRTVQRAYAALTKGKDPVSLLVLENRDLLVKLRYLYGLMSEKMIPIDADMITGKDREVVKAVEKVLGVDRE